MRYLFYGLFALSLSFLAESALAQNARPNIVIPESSIVHPEDAGLRAHTNTQILNDPNAVVPDLYGGNPHPQLPPGAGFYETPASLACIYGLVPKSQGCNPQVVTKLVKGGSKIVAIVDAFDDPTALVDLQEYSRQFGLPPVDDHNFQVIYASGTKPPFNAGWQQEEALDTQMVHALAPKAMIILVEAASNSLADLLQAEMVAAKAVAAGGEISNSWGSNEFTEETTPDFTTPFTKDKVVFFASTGDTETPSYPAVLPNVVAVGGTSVLRDSAGNFLLESSWTEAGAGPSAFVPRPAFQSSVQTIVGSQRGVADISADANPNTGVWVRVAGQWLIFGGTSVSCPIVAAITNTAKDFLPSTTAELNKVYQHLGTNVFNDIKQGTCSVGQSQAAMAGYDFCTGVGSPKGRGGL